jgi:uncharacterized protein (TIGR02246 family)
MQNQATIFGGSMRRSFLLLSVIVTAACNPKPAASVDSTAMADSSKAAANNAQSMDDAKAAIGKVRDGWKDKANNKDSAGVADYYTDDAEMVGTEIPLAKGKDAIRHSFAQSFPISKINSIDSRELVVDGNMAYDYGEFSQDVTPPPAGKTQNIHGYYLVVLRKQADGSWKIAKHIATTPPKG